MSGILRKILPAVASIPRDVGDDDDDFDVEYSFAMEYNGPSVNYNIPRVVPLEIGHIPTASAAVSASLKDLSLPVIQPIVKRNPLRKSVLKDSNLGSEASESLNSVAAFEERGKEGHDHVLSDESVNSASVEFFDGPDMPCKSSDVVDGSEGSITNDERKSKKLDEIGSSGSLRPSESFHDPHELSGRSNGLGLLDDNEGIGFQDFSNHTNGSSDESSLTSESLSSENYSCEEDCENESPSHVRKPSVVTFRDPESCDVVYAESGHDEVDIIQVRQLPDRKGKKGSCYRCGKGNWLTAKEICIVCNAKFCGNCVLRTMGSMPEGRKCVICIGRPIDESKRESLGKCSWLLKQLLTKPTVEEVMRLEMQSKANQLPPALIFVNDKALSQGEMILLQSCPKPPKRLSPGRYWYDKVSGFWGKEGQKPSQVISAHLNVGNNLMRNASNGKTNVLINNREITKPELLMLKLAGIECEGKPHFWLSADGSYQEEGQNNVRGKVGDKSRMKLICIALSLPIPSEIVNTSEKANQLLPTNHLEEKTLHKLLLVGFGKSGTSTIFKQAKLLYNVPFSEDERQNIKVMIQSNLFGYLGILLEARQQFEEESLIRKGQSVDQSGPSGSGNTDQNEKRTIYSIGPRLKRFSDWLVNVMMSGNLESIFPAATREYAPFVEELWKNPAIQATYNQIIELETLPRVANYFLDRAVEISRTDYEPSDTDILYAEGITLSNGLASAEFSFPKSSRDGCMDPAYHHDPSLRYQIIRVHPRSLGENCKWLDMFEDVGVVLFCVNLTDYDQFCDYGNGILINKMVASKKLFESIVTHPTFYDKDFLLILNKFDLLEEKIEQFPLTKCEWFSDFNPVISYNPIGGSNINVNPSLAQRAFHYIATKFKRLFKFLTGPEPEHKLYVSRVTALEPDSVDEALRYTREILKWNEEKPNFDVTELTSYSIEPSSSSRYSH